MRRAAMATSGPLTTAMLARVRAVLAPTHVELVNESQGHGGDAAAESHFKLLV